MQALFGKTIDLLSAMLDFRAERHKVIVSNIANIETPSYRPKDLDFPKRLGEAMAAGQEVEMRRTNKKHIPPPTDKADQFRLTQVGDKVEIDREMTNLAGNNLMYNLTAELLSRKFKGINAALKETR
jgi:flagellar basal-body rod protein FlgB